MNAFLLHALLPAHCSPELQPRWVLVEVHAESYQAAVNCMIASGYLSVQVPSSLPANARPETILYAGMIRNQPPAATPPAEASSSQSRRPGYGCLPSMLWVALGLFFLVLLPPLGAAIFIGLVIYVAVREAVSFSR